MPKRYQDHPHTDPKPEPKATPELSPERSKTIPNKDPQYHFRSIKQHTATDDHRQPHTISPPFPGAPSANARAPLNTTNELARALRSRAPQVQHALFSLLGALGRSEAPLARSKALMESTGTAQGRPTTPQGRPKGALGTPRERPRAPQGRKISIFEKRTALVPQHVFHLPGPRGALGGAQERA